MAEVERRVGGREVGAPVDAARFAPARGPRRRSARERIGVLEESLQAAARRGSDRRAPRPPPGSRSSARGTGVGLGRRRRLGRRGLPPARRAAARVPKTKHSLSEFEASRLAPCRPVQAHSPTARVRPGRAAVEVGPRRRPSCSGRRGRPGPARARDRGRPREQGRRRREALRGRPRAGRGDRAVAVGAIRSRIAAVTASRGASSSVKRRPAASSSSAPSPRTASVISQPSSGCRAAPARSGGTGRTRGRRGRPRRRRRAPGRRRSPPRVRRPLPQRRAAAGRQHRRAARRSAPGSVSTPWQRAPSLHRASAEVPSSTSIRALGGGQLRQPAGHAPGRSRLPPAWTIRRAVWPPSRPSARLAVGLEVEARRRARAGPRPPPAPRRQDLDRGRVAEAAAGVERVLGVAGGRVVGRDRRGEPALRPEARALGQRLARDERDPPARLGGLEGDVQSRRPATDDGDVGGSGRSAERGRVGQVGEYRTPHRWVSISAIPHRSRTTPGAHPENAGRIRAIEAMLEEAGWPGLERLEPPVAEREWLLRVHDPAMIDAIEELCATRAAG